MKIMLINRENPISMGFKPYLKEIGGGYMLERHAAEYMKAMICAAMADGIKLRVFSAYRSISYQQGLFNQDIERYVLLGMSHDEAVQKASLNIAMPGSSEHNAGLAADITSMDWHGEITEEFENTPEFKWLNNNAHCFGFILRYPKNKTHITGFTYEPWHYRYVGKSHACCIKRMNITLEEYLKLQCCV